MNRRAFLGLAGLGAAGFVMDPEMLLWRPGTRKFFIPSLSQVRYYTSVVMPNGYSERGERITASAYRRALGKSIVWMDAPNETRVDFPFVSAQSFSGRHSITYPSDWRLEAVRAGTHGTFSYGARVSDLIG